MTQHRPAIAYNALDLHADRRPRRFTRLVPLSLRPRHAARAVAR